MNPRIDLALTALAPMIWGTTYVVTTALLPQGYPLTAAALRALPAGLLLLAFARRLPEGAWWWRAFVLGGLNFTVFWTLLFVSAYRLPGGVAATIGALQPLIVIGLARVALGRAIKPLAVVAAVVGAAGVALLVLTPKAALDPLGIVAGVTGACAMAAGTVLTRRWRPPVSLLGATAWQLTAGGLLLAPLALAFEPSLPPLDLANVAGFAYLGLIGAAFTYVLWFRGVARLEPSAVAALGFLSPVTAVAIGVFGLGETLSPPQMLGVAMALGSVWLGQRAA